MRFNGFSLALGMALGATLMAIGLQFSKSELCNESPPPVGYGCPYSAEPVAEPGVPC